MLIQLEHKRNANLRVGDLAKATGKTVRALHLYEERGLLTPSRRSKGGYRLYDREAITRVRWISKLQDMGFSLSQLQEIVRHSEASVSAPGAMRRLTSLYEDKLDETREQIRRLRALEGGLQSSLEYLETCDTCDPSRLMDHCSACELHDCDEHAPDLVAGLHPAVPGSG